MKVEYGSTTLGDDSAGDFITDDGGAHARLTQQTPLAGGDPFHKDRGNHSNVRSFTISKQHASLAAAKAWFNRHPDELDGQAELRITQNSDADKMPDAVLQGVDRVQLMGASTILRYTFLGGRITQAV